MRIVCISDTHMHYPNVPFGDVLIHAGDATYHGHKEEVEEFASWWETLPHRHKIFVPGNHDWLFQLRPMLGRAMLKDTTHVLIDEDVYIERLRFHGTPWQPAFGNWAFGLPRGEILNAHWDLVPDDTDVLITHSPPFGILDLTKRGENVGDHGMLDMVLRVKPALHVFGHIHESYGIAYRNSLPGGTFVNASICDRKYDAVNEPIVVDL